MTETTDIVRSTVDGPGPASNSDKCQNGATTTTAGAPDDVREWSAEHDLVYPEGGWTAWSQVLAGNMLNALAWGYPATFGVYQLYYTEKLHLPSAQISWIGSIQIFLTFAICTISGRLTDAGYARQAVLVGCTVVVFGTFMTSLCTTYWQIMLAQGICTGMGLGVLFMPSVAIIGSYFKERRSLALAISATGTGVGSLIFPSTLQYLIPQVGFPWAINTYARKVVGFSTTESVSLLLITNGLGIPSRPVVGYVADRYLGPINTFMLTTFILGCMEFVWIGVKTRTGMYIFSVFFGLSNGAAQGVFVGALASLTADPQKMGTRFGMIATLSGFASLAGPPTAGAIIDRSGGQYLGAQIWGGVVIIAGSLTVGAARVAKAGKAWGAKL
ncbi:hypothetical protein COL940_001029 [Colletotrichum noveboracense]|nr:hypothetical protein COL940_001029 [Colletotrichum noveboracense]